MHSIGKVHTLATDALALLLTHHYSMSMQQASLSLQPSQLGPKWQMHELEHATKPMDATSVAAQRPQGTQGSTQGCTALPQPGQWLTSQPQLSHPCGQTTITTHQSVKPGYTRAVAILIMKAPLQRSKHYGHQLFTKSVLELLPSLQRVLSLPPGWAHVICSEPKTAVPCISHTPHAACKTASSSKPSRALPPKSHCQEKPLHNPYPGPPTLAHKQISRPLPMPRHHGGHTPSRQPGRQMHHGAPSCSGSEK